MERYLRFLKQWRMVIILSAVLILITSVPYLYGYFRTPRGSTYTGLHAMTPGDFHVYYSQMRLAREGNMSTSNPYAGIDGIGSVSMINPFWYALGTVARFTHLSLPLVFHLARIILIPALVIVVHQLIYFFLPSAFRRVAMGMVMFCSGIGYFVYPFIVPGPERPHIYAWPLDIWVPESNTFLTLFHSPHLLASLILFLFILVAFLKSLVSLRPWGWQVGAGLSAAALGYFHPFHLLTLAVVLLVWTVILGSRVRSRTFASITIIGLMASPSIWWHAARAAHDWATMEWARSNITLTPPLWTVATAYGLLIPCAVAGAYFLVLSQRALRVPDRASHIQHTSLWLLLSWWCVHFVLIYSPLIIQRRLIEGMHVPLALLAGVGMVWFKNFLDAKREWPFFVRTALIAGTWLVLISSTLGTVSRDFALFYYQERRFYLSSDLKKVFQKLHNQGDRSGVVLAGYTSSNYIPAWTGRTVYGTPGGAHSPLFEEVRRPMISWFIAGKGSVSQRRRFLQRERITAVVVGPMDGLDASALSSDSLLVLQFAHDGTFLYFVR